MCRMATLMQQSDKGCAATAQLLTSIKVQGIRQGREVQFEQRGLLMQRRSTWLGVAREVKLALEGTQLPSGFLQATWGQWQKPARSQ